jgi:hypothetical protein
MWSSASQNNKQHGHGDWPLRQLLLTAPPLHTCLPLLPLTSPPPLFNTTSLRPLPPPAPAPILFPSLDLILRSPVPKEALAIPAMLNMMVRGIASFLS